MSSCCIKGFRWEAEPVGRETLLAGRKCYVTGSNASVAIMIIHDLYGWTFRNTQLLADHYAEEVGATVYVPDFFGGEIISPHLLSDPDFMAKLDLPSFLGRNSKAIREPEMVECAKALRERYLRFGVIGFCFGGWAVFRLGAKGRQLVDCISTAHPTNLTKEEIQNVDVPVQILAPEIDPMFTEDLKEFSHKTIPKLGVAFDYQFFPGLEHAFAIRGDERNPAERAGMEKAKNAAVFWFRQWLSV